VDEDELLPLSALSHMVFCERRAALVHVERVWSENAYTVEGNHLHKAVDERGRRQEVRRELFIARGVHLRSFALGLAGQADVVEFHRDDDGVPLPGRQGNWRPYPVDYKRGRPKPDESDRVHLCGQALALEEMLSVGVPAGSLFYGKTRRRLEVLFDEPLRALTQETAHRFRDLVASRQTPSPFYSTRCEGCSLKSICQPTIERDGGAIARYLRTFGKVP
jgi:CRISPR-associated exonuclease Cas4